MYIIIKNAAAQELEVMEIEGNPKVCNRCRSTMNLVIHAPQDNSENISVFWECNSVICKVTAAMTISDTFDVS